MRKFLVLGLLMALFIGTASAALFESGTKDAQPTVLYGKYNNTIVPIKVAADGSVGAGGGGGTNATYVVCASDKTAAYNCDYTCDGTNDQTEINQAIDAAAALTTGGKVLLTEGSFYIGNNGTSVIPKSKVWLQGQGGATGTTILFATTGLGSNPTIWNNGAALSYMRLSDFKIDGTAQRAVTWNVNQKGISVWGDDNTHNTIDHLWVYNTPATCIAPDGNDYLLVDSNIMELCGTLSPNGPGGTGSPNSGGNGFPLGSNGLGYGQDDNNVRKSVIITNNITISVASAGILFEEQGSTTAADYGFIIANNIDYGSYNAIRVSGTSGITINSNQSYNPVDACFVATTNTFSNIAYKNIIISNNQCYQAGADGILVGTSTSVLASYIRISGNLIDTPTTYGMRLYSTNTSVTDNTILSAGQDGIYYLSGQSLGNINITGNSILTSGTAATATHISAINLKTSGAGVNFLNFNISNNILRSSAGYGITTELGTGTYTNFIVRNNTFSNNTTGTVNLTGSTFTVGSNYFPFNNVGYTTTTNTIGGDAQIVNTEGLDASLLLDADDGDNAPDSWFLKSMAATNNLDILNDTTTVLSVTSAGNLSNVGTITSSATGSLGWSIVDQTDNQACTTGCTSACVFGIENATGSAITGIVDCAATTSDLCACAGAS